MPVRLHWVVCAELVILRAKSWGEVAHLFDPLGDGKGRPGIRHGINVRFQPFLPCWNKNQFSTGLQGVSQDFVEILYASKLLEAEGTQTVSLEHLLLIFEAIFQSNLNY